MIAISTSDVLMAMTAATGRATDPEAYREAVRHLSDEVLADLAKCAARLKRDCTPEAVEMFAPAWDALNEAGRAQRADIARRRA